MMFRSRQGLHCMPSFEDEVRRRREWTSMQALSDRQSRMYFRRVESWQTFNEVSIVHLMIGSVQLNLRHRKHEILTRSLRKMERTLDTVLRSLGNPSLTAGMLSRSPSPTPQAQQTQALLASPSPPQSPTRTSHGPTITGSPKLHSLPDNTLNPLGLLAEASLANRRAQQAAAMMDPPATPGSAEQQGTIGVASASYFKPGMWIFSQLAPNGKWRRI